MTGVSVPGAEMSLHERPCPTCGSRQGELRMEAKIDAEALDEYAFASRKTPELMHHRILRCGECATLYASPAPTGKDLERAYREAAFDSSDEARYAAQTYVRGLRRVLGDPAGWGPVLDIGTGDGAFLAESRAAGATELTGVEPSEAPIASAEPAIRPLIRQGLFDPADFEPGSFGLITCFQTIEHVPDPLELSRGTFELLRPGGAFAIVCHDYRALTNRILGRRSPLYDLEHLQLYSRQPVTALMEQSGFTMTATRTLVNRYPLRYWVRLAPIPAGAKRRILRGLSGRVGSLPIPMRVGNLLAVARRD